METKTLQRLWGENGDDDEIRQIFSVHNFFFHISHKLAVERVEIPKSETESNKWFYSGISSGISRSISSKSD